MRPTRRLVLDHNFPLPIVQCLQPSLVEAELYHLESIDRRLPLLEDWELIVKLHQMRRFDGLVTADSQMTSRPKEMSAVKQLRWSLVVTDVGNNDPIRATGLLLVHLSRVCAQIDPRKGQIWTLRAAPKAWEKPDAFLAAIAQHRQDPVGEFRRAHRLSDSELHTDPLRRLAKQPEQTQKPGRRGPRRRRRG